MSTHLIERYNNDLQGVLSCYGRVAITGTLPGVCYARSMTGYLYANQIKAFDHGKELADPLRNKIRGNAQMIAKAHGINIGHVNNPRLRKEDPVSKVLVQRGGHPGLVHILSAMAACSAYGPWHDKQTHKTYPRPAPGKCLHYYFYFMDAGVGLCYLRVPAWCPFRLQFHCNGHSWLARKVTRNKQPPINPSLNLRSDGQIVLWQ